jgi:7-cyano-7-deazaguanine synthase
MSKAYVLLSGGMDSTTCLAQACKTFGETNVTAISIQYGQRHSDAELSAAQSIVSHFHVKWVIKNLANIIGIGGLTDNELVVPHMSYEELGEGISPTYVPFRNGLMLATLASSAMADSEAEAIYYGAHAEDAANDAYPDCSIPFIQSMADAIRIGTYGQIELRAPLGSMSKAEVVQFGETLNVPWYLTWSCYEGGDLHCGKCPTCISRMDAFAIAGLLDPTEYAE